MKAADRAAVIDAHRYRPRQGARVYPYYDSEQTPCGCVTGEFEGVASVAVDLIGKLKRCLHCGKRWPK